MAGEEAGLERPEAQGLSVSNLEALIRTVPDFPEAGILFRDITTLLADGAGLRQAIDGLADLAKDCPVDAVAGIEARGFIFGTALALQMGVGFVPLRKAGKLPVATISEDYALEYGQATLECDPTNIPKQGHVLLVDDLLATGGTARAGAQLLRRAGAKCDTALFVIELPALGGQAALAQAQITPKSLIAYPGE